MAKWGEGDPRWIVEERPDATNVNNWHWTEKNATPWSTDKLKSLLTNFKISDNGIEIEITEVEKLEGESSANNRKGKLIFFYEWNIVLKWSGQFPGQETPSFGKVTIPNLSEENELNEIEITITIDENNSESESLKQFMYNIGRDKIRKQLGTYVTELKEEFSKGMILPKKDEDQSNQKLKKNDNIANITSGFNKKALQQPIISSRAKTNVGLKLDVKTITLVEKFQCQANALYDALTRIEMVTAFTRGPVKLEPSKGGEFSFFGGNIIGKFEELIPEQKIRQSWRYKQWPEGHYSNVLMEFEEMGDHTQLTLTQTGVPSAEVDTTRKNWERYYWNSLRQTFGFGSFLE